MPMDVLDRCLSVGDRKEGLDREKALRKKVSVKQTRYCGVGERSSNKKAERKRQIKQSVEGS
jgi:hypothetical protein